MSKSVSLKALRLNLVKLECMIIQLDLDTIKKARNKLDEACGLPLVLTMKRDKFVSSTKYKTWKPIFINHKSISLFVHITSQKIAWKYKKKKVKNAFMTVLHVINRAEDG